MSKQFGYCRKCRLEKRLIKAHIIPRVFFKRIRGQDKHAIQMDLDAKRLMNFWQAGVYDSILGEDCERSFSDLDKYGWEILGSPCLDKPILDARGRPRRYRVECDTQRLKRFVLSVLWRASVSSASFYEYADLGSAYESSLLERIFESLPMDVEEFATIIYRFDETKLGEYQGVLFPPMRQRFEGLNGYVIYLPGIKIMVKVDRRPHREFLSVIRLGEPGNFLGEPGYFLMPSHPKPNGPFPELGYIDHVLRRFQSRPEAKVAS